MDALSLLKSDHERVKNLFTSFETERNGGKGLERLAKQMVRELSIHASIEEAIFYPMLKKKGGELADKVLEALEEHHVAKWLLDEIDGMKESEERFKPKVKVLIENVRHHIQEEERELFPQVREKFTENELWEMGEALEAAKKVAPTRPHPRAPDEPPGNLVAGMVAGLIDRGRDALSGTRILKRPVAAAKSVRQSIVNRTRSGRARVNRKSTSRGRGRTGGDRAKSGGRRSSRSRR